MSEATPNGQRDNAELAGLLRELEAQIESVNAGLGKIRGTVARITFATLNTAAPAPASAWGGNLGSAPANRNEWQSSAIAEAAVTPAPEPFAASPSPTFAEHTTLPALHPEPVQEAPADFWTSVAEGASWPRAHANDEPIATAEPTPEASNDDFAWAGFHAQSNEGDEAAGPELETVAEEPVAAVDEMPALELAETPAGDAPGEAAAPLAVEDKPATVDGMPSELSRGWPDESAWSQSFEWPAMKPEQSATPEPAVSDDLHVNVSDIVAKVKAEMAAARAQGVDFDQDADAPEAEADAAQSTTEPASRPPREEDDAARRDEVSRAVAEIRQQIDAGDFEAAMRSHGYDPEKHDRTAQAEPSSASSSEEDVRAEVRRAVEATREELSTGRPEPAHAAEKPAFRLAAPGSIPDWSHIQMEPSGPPVVVMKDADGRVELASVYETLNELGCGDGAALLNYTPHSVTVGLPIAARFPTKEQVAQAVEKVFGLTSRVESDGVRITVSIGEDSKRRSVDAA